MPRTWSFTETWPVWVRYHQDHSQGALKELARPRSIIVHTKATNAKLTMDIRNAFCRTTGVSSLAGT